MALLFTGISLTSTVSTINRVDPVVEAISLVLSTTPVISGLGEFPAISINEGQPLVTNFSAPIAIRIVEAGLLGIEVDIATDAELSGVEIDIATDAELSGIEIDIAVDAELAGIEIGANLPEDLAHPEWSGTPGLIGISVNSDLTVDFTVGSSITDNFGKPFYEVFLALGTLVSDTLFIEANSIGAFSFGNYKASKLRDGTFIVGGTAYTAGVRLIDEYRNIEAQSTIINFMTAVVSLSLLDAPTISVVDNGDFDSVTVTLDTVSSDGSYDHTNVYLLQGPTSEPGYKILIGVLTSTGDFLTITGLIEGQLFKVIAVSITGSEGSGFVSITDSVIVGSETNIPRLPDGTVASRFPTIGGDNIGQGVKYPIQLEDSGTGTRIAFSKGTPRLQEAIIYTLQTKIRENLQNPDLGSKLSTLNFGPQSEALAQVIPSMIRETIEINVPRVTILDVEVRPSNQSGTLIIEITWAAKDSVETGTILFPFDQAE